MLCACCCGELATGRPVRHLCTQQEETPSSQELSSPLPLHSAAWVSILDLISGAWLPFILFTPFGDEFVFCPGLPGSVAGRRAALINMSA